MPDPRTWVYGDPEPGPDVDAVTMLYVTGDLGIWWRFGEGWRNTYFDATLTWDGLSCLGTLTEALPEHEYTQGQKGQQTPDGYVDYFKAGDA